MLLVLLFIGALVYVVSALACYRLILHDNMESRRRFDLFDLACVVTPGLNTLEAVLLLAMSEDI